MDWTFRPNLESNLNQLDDKEFNQLLFQLRELKQIADQPEEVSQKDNRSMIDRFLRLRRFDPKTVSTDLTELIDTSQLIKTSLISILLDQEELSIIRDKLLIPNQSDELKQFSLPQIAEPIVNDSPQPTKTTLIDYSPREETESEDEVINQTLDYVRPPIPIIRDTLIQSYRSNYSSFHVLVQKCSILKPSEIGDIWNQLANDKILSPDIYQTLLNKLTIDSEQAMFSFLTLFDQNQTYLSRLAELLWDVGINIYSDESKTNLSKQEKKIVKPTINKSNNLSKAWNILETHLTDEDRRMIGVWIGWSRNQIQEFILADCISDCLVDKLLIVRSMDALKIKYGSIDWLIKLADLLSVPLGKTYGLNMTNQILKPIQIQIN